MICFHTKFHLPSCNSLPIITITPKTKNARLTQLTYSCYAFGERKKKMKKLHTVFSFNYQTKYQNRTLSGDTVAPTHTFAFPAYLHCRRQDLKIYDKGVVDSSDMIFRPTFMKFC